MPAPPFRELASLLLLASCVQGTRVPTELIPPEVLRFEADTQGWCGECGTIVVDWNTKGSDEVTIITTIEGQPAKPPVAGAAGTKEIEVCGNTTGEGATGFITLVVPGLVPAHPPIPIQQTLDGEVKTVTFEPRCDEGSFLGGWSDATGFSEALFPADILVTSLRNWTYWGPQGPEGPLKTKIRVGHDPSPKPPIILDDTWVELDPKPPLFGVWSGEPESPGALNVSRCATGPDDPVTDATALPLVAKATVQCSN